MEELVLLDGLWGRGYSRHLTDFMFGVCVLLALSAPLQLALAGEVETRTVGGGVAGWTSLDDSKYKGVTLVVPRHRIYEIVHFLLTIRRAANNPFMLPPCRVGYLVSCATPHPGYR